MVRQLPPHNDKPPYTFTAKIVAPLKTELPTTVQYETLNDLESQINIEYGHFGVRAVLIEYSINTQEVAELQIMGINNDTIYEEISDIVKGELEAVAEEVDYMDEDEDLAKSWEEEKGKKKK